MLSGAIVGTVARIPEVSEWNLEIREVLTQNFIKFGNTNHTGWQFSVFSVGFVS